MLPPELMADTCRGTARVLLAFRHVTETEQGKTAGGRSLISPFLSSHHEITTLQHLLKFSSFREGFGLAVCHQARVPAHPSPHHTSVRVRCKDNRALLHSFHRVSLLAVSHRSHMVGAYSNSPCKFHYCVVYLCRSATGMFLKDSAWTTGYSPPTYLTACSIPHSSSPPSW